jgi:hypothetical protein
VQVEPPYAPSRPLAPVSTSDESTLEFTMLVDEAVVAVIAVVDAYGNCEAATVDEAKKTPWVRMEEEVADVEVLNEFREVNGYAKPDLLLKVVQSPDERQPF